MSCDTDLTLTLKRGATFRVQMTHAESITGWLIRSQVRSPDGAVLALLSVENRNDTARTYELSAPASATESWPVGDVYLDARYEMPSGDVDYAPTVTVQVVDSITAAP